MKKLILLFTAVMAMIACSSNDSSETSIDGNNYNKTILLTNWADNIIIPRYVNYQAKLEVLASNTASFNSAPTTVNLQTLRTSWVEAYKAYQYVALFGFGKADEIFLKQSANTYPTSAVGIESNISSTSYNLTLLSQFDKQGFPAIDYLINGLNTTDAGIVTYYTVNTNAVNYKKYLTDVVARLKSNADTVLNDWNNGYRAAYIANSGTSVSSSVNITTNNFVKNLEKNVRSGKLGIPAGLFSNGVKYPEKVEAFYKNDISKELLNTAIKASQDFFNGQHFNKATSGESLKSYLDYRKVIRNGSNLSTIINNQFNTVLEVNATLNNSFSTQVTSDNAKMILANDALQQNVIYTKLDMMQALNITIDYVDSDGD